MKCGEKMTFVRRFIGSLLFLSVILSACSPVSVNPSITPAATRNPTPLADRDLSQLILQSEDLPADFVNYSLQDFAKAFPNTPDVQENVENAAVMTAYTADNRRVFSNGIIAYMSEDQAGRAFQAIKNDLRGSEQTFKIQPLGDQSYAMTDVVSSEAIANNIYLAMILWQEGSTVSYISAVNATEQPDLKQIEQLARTVQGRISD